MGKNIDSQLVEVTKSAGNVLTDSILAVFGKLHLEIRIYQ